MNNLVTKESIIYNDCVIGEVRVSDLLDFITALYVDMNKFEDIIYDILKEHDFDNKTISSLLNLNHHSGIKLVIDMLNSLK